MRTIAQLSALETVDMAARFQKVSVLLGLSEAERFDAFCREKGFKKSTLIARLIRDHLDRELFRPQLALFDR